MCSRISSLQLARRIALTMFCLSIAVPVESAWSTPPIAANPEDVPAYQNTVSPGASCPGGVAPKCDYFLPVGDGPSQVICTCNDCPEGQVRDCTGVCGGHVEVDDCGVCGGDDSSCGGQCPAYGLKIKAHPLGSKAQPDFSQIRDLGTSTDQGVCLNRRLDDAIASCEKIKLGKLYFDDCVVAQLANVQANDKYIATQCTRAYYGRIEVKPKNGKCSPAINRGVPTTATIAHGYIFYDSACNVVDVPPKDQIEECLVGTIWWKVSPISLLLDTERLEESTIANFSLDPHQCPSCVYEWKASAKAPLLVYDPEHRGQITSATQLFGDWTFGGRQVAALVSGGQTSKWNDGFQALGSLDANLDGVISDSELAPLALWFDKNRDGISDPGEVKPLAEVGITKLYYQHAVKDAQTGDIVLTKGFEREVNGQVQSGTSIDWYAEGALSADELIGKKLTGASFNKLQQPALADKPLIEDTSPRVEPEVSASKSASGLAGAWNWKAAIANHGNSTYGGVLVFAAADEAGVVGGTSFHETRFDPFSSKEAASVLSMQQFELTHTANGFAFELQSETGRIQTQFRLVKNGTELEGETSVQSSVKGSVGSLSYKWIATRRR